MAAMKATALLACIALLLTGCARDLPATPEATVAIVGATVVHPERSTGAAVERDRTILVSGNRIRAIVPASTPLPAGAKVVDAKGKWVIPGLVDGHVHFFQSGNVYTRPDAADLNKLVPYAQEVARNKARLPATFKVWIASGVTSVVDVGGPFWNFEVRDAARRTEAAPRVAVAGPLISMVDRPQLDLGDPPIIRIDSAAAARALVAKQLPLKPDYIKVWFIHRPGDDLAAQEAIVRATADAAHTAGVRLAVHATELVTAKAALRAGADYLVHSVEDKLVDEEFIALARRNRAIYCPTLFVVMGYRYALSATWEPTEAERRLADPEILGSMQDLKKAPPESLPPRIAQLIAKPPKPEPEPVALANLKRVWDAGIPVAMGTDAGNVGTLHGPSVFREMALMTRAGLSPLEVLRSATVNGAKAMGREDIGVIAPGKLADLVILDADPLASVANLERITAVVKDGRLYDPHKLIASIRR